MTSKDSSIDYMALWLLFFSLRLILSSISCSLKQSNQLLSMEKMSREKKLNKDGNPPYSLWNVKTDNRNLSRTNWKHFLLFILEILDKLPMGQRDFTDFICLFSLNGLVPPQYIVVLIEMFISLAVWDTAFQYPENRWTLHWNYLKVVVLSASYVLNFLLNQSM